MVEVFMKRKKGFLAMLTLSVFLLIGAFVTVIPFEEADKISLLGYGAVSAMAPVSTILFSTGALVVQILRRRFFTA